MQTDRILQLAARIKTMRHVPDPEGTRFKGQVFCMAGFRVDSEDYCGTALCIAGLADAMWPQPRVCGSTTERASIAMGLHPEKQGVPLFYANGAHLPLHKLTPAMAATCLTRLAETGVVDWNAAIKEHY